jgi:hypothetical protein
VNGALPRAARERAILYLRLAIREMAAEDGNFDVQYEATEGALRILKYGYPRREGRMLRQALASLTGVSASRGGPRPGGRTA